jgi:hypothetical protein
MANWFLITSAFNVAYGSYNTNERFEQTKKTIESIRQFCNDTKIVLLEASPNPITQEQLEYLKQTCDIIVDHSSDKKIQAMHKGLHIHAVKSPSEIYIILKFLKQQNVIKDADRVFKISGRYYLNSQFDPIIHMSAIGKFVFGTKFPGIQYYDVDTHEKYEKLCEWQYKTRLYSFCGSLVPYYTKKCEEMLDFFHDIYGKEYTDLEHVTYKFLGEDNVIEVNKIGVSGWFADREQLVKE